MKHKQDQVLYRSQIEILDSLIPFMVLWAKEREEFVVVLENISAMAFDLGAPRFGSEWYVESRVEYVVSKIITTKRLLEAFQKDLDEQLSTRQKFLLHQLTQNPAYWVFCEMPEESDLDLITIEVSPSLSIRHMVHDAEITFFFPHQLMLVFYNGLFVQTCGFLHLYACLDSNAFSFYLAGLCHGDPPEINSEAMTELITTHYYEIILLDSIAHEQDTVIGADYIEVFWGNYTLPSNFIPRNVLGRWRHSRSGNFLCMVYDKADKQLLQQEIPPHLKKGVKEGWEFSEFITVALFIDLKHNRLAAFANSLNAWQVLCYLLAPTILEIEPEGIAAEYRISLPTLSVTAQIPDFHFPWSYWQPMLTPLAKSVLEETCDIAKSRAVLHEYLDTDDPRFDLTARSERMNVNPYLIEELALVMDALDEMEDPYIGSFSLTSIEGDFELHDFPLLFPQVLDKLPSPLSQSTLFTIDVLNAYPLFASSTNGVFIDEIQASDLIEQIEDLFYELYTVTALAPFVAMNYLFLLFLHTKSQWFPVRTYAIELLKLFYSSIEKEEEEIDADLLVAQISHFIYNTLCPYALVETKKEPSSEQLVWGTYSIRPSDFFRTLIRRANI